MCYNTAANCSLGLNLCGGVQTPGSERCVRQGGCPGSTPFACPLDGLYSAAGAVCSGAAASLRAGLAAGGAVLVGAMAAASFIALSS